MKVVILVIKVVVVIFCILKEKIWIKRIVKNIFKIFVSICKYRDFLILVIFIN